MSSTSLHDVREFHGVSGTVAFNDGRSAAASSAPPPPIE
jgi:hypothetical protein